MMPRRADIICMRSGMIFYRVYRVIALKYVNALLDPKKTNKVHTFKVHVPSFDKK